MTTTGLEPSLPRPADDNAPMISGRGTRIIAGARGAYLAGSLRTLIDALDEDREAHLRMAFLRLGIHLAESWLRYEDGMPELRALNAIRRWADHPDSDTPPDAYAILTNPLPDEWAAVQPGQISAQGVTLLHLEAVITSPRLSLVHTYPLAALNLRLAQARRSHTESETPIEKARSRAKQWQLDAAWALLHGKEPPPYPEVAP